MSVQQEIAESIRNLTNGSDNEALATESLVKFAAVEVALGLPQDSAAALNARRGAALIALFSLTEVIGKNALDEGGSVNEMKTLVTRQLAAIAKLEELQAIVSGEYSAQAVTGGRFKTVKGYQTEDTYHAVVGSITVSGKQFDTLLSEGSFNLSREDQIAYAKSLRYRIANREEHWVYVDSLLAKEDAGTINDAEKNALETYRMDYVRDEQGGLGVDARRITVFAGCWDGGVPYGGALFVRESEETK